jgi:hypothetical protein
MNAPPGSAVSSSTEPKRSTIRIADAVLEHRPRSGYLHKLALRREALSIRQQTVYGLIMGWFLTLVAGFLFYCVRGSVDWLWAALMMIGLAHLACAALLPQALAWPERLWIAVARWQGWLVMTVLLTLVYYTLIWPAAQFCRRRTRGFVAWDNQPPISKSAWEPIDLAGADTPIATGGRYRSLPVLLASVIGFFFRRGNLVLLAIVILLSLLGLTLFFVQNSALAPFIYTLF